MNDLLKSHLEKMDNSPPIDVCSLADFNFRTSPEELAANMADMWRYDAITENRTGGPAGFAAQIQTYLPHANDPDSDFGLYLPRWLRHELPHGGVAELALQRVGQEIPPPMPQELPPVVLLLGRIAQEHPYFEDISEGVIATQGCRNEKMTFDHYRLEENRLIQFGEEDFAQEVVRYMRNQEAIHLGWNKEKLREVVRQRSWLQLQVIAAADKQLWQPVGAKSKLYRPELVNATRQLSEGQEGEVISMTDHVQKVADEILGARLPGRKNQAFVLKKVLKVIPELGETLHQAA